MTKKQKSEIFLKNLKVECARKGTSPTKVMKALGLSTGSPTHWKNGGALPQIDTMQKIADYLGITLVDLLPNSTSSVADVEQPVATFLAIDRLISLWERDKGEAKIREDRLFGMISEQQKTNAAQAHAIEVFAEKMDAAQQCDRATCTLGEIPAGIAPQISIDG
jgi:transcriptional regulator with XRE-family HTH domain